MSLYSLVVSLHVVVALLGVGLLGALPLGARSARRLGLGLSLAGKLSEAVALRRIELWGSAAISAVACIVVLMESKPF